MKNNAGILDKDSDSKQITNLMLTVSDILYLQRLKVSYSPVCISFFIVCEEFDRQLCDPSFDGIDDITDYEPWNKDNNGWDCRPSSITNTSRRILFHHHSTYFGYYVYVNEYRFEKFLP